MKDLYALFRQSLAGLRLLIAATLLLGLAYPLVVYGVGQVAAPWQANGSLVTADGSHTTDADEAVGSALIGQLVDDAGLFQPRPSAAGDGYDTLVVVRLQPRARGARPGRGDQGAQGRDRRARGRRPERRAAGRGHRLRLRPRPRHLAGVRRRSRCRGSPRPTGSARTQVRDLVDEQHLGPDLGVLGEPRVNVLDAQHRRPQAGGERLRTTMDDVDRRRGRLTVYLGAAPGVGQDLRDARRGAAAAAPAAPTSSSGSSRPTAASTPRRSSTGSRWCRAARSPTAAPTFTEMDVDAVLARKPAVVLRRRARAHQRARAAGTRSAPRTSRSSAPPGIDVITTVNIQHLESLNDEVERITGVRQRETVPGRGGPHRRPDPARRHVPRRAAPADGARQHLQARADRRLAHVVLPGRQPHRAARAGAAVAGRPGRRRARRLPARAPDRGAVAGQGADRRRGHRRPRERDAAPARRPARPARRRRRSCWPCT